MNHEDNRTKLNNAFALEYEETLYKLTKSLEKYPRNLIDLCYRGRIYFILGRYEEALRDWTELLKIEQDNIITIKYRAEVNYLMKKYNESIDDLEYLLKIEPDEPDNAWILNALQLVKEA